MATLARRKDKLHSNDARLIPEMLSIAPRSFEQMYIKRPEVVIRGEEEVIVFNNGLWIFGQTRHVATPLMGVMRYAA